MIIFSKQLQLSRITIGLARYALRGVNKPEKKKHRKDNLFSILPEVARVS